MRPSGPITRWVPDRLQTLAGGSRGLVAGLTDCHGKPLEQPPGNHVQSLRPEGAGDGVPREVHHIGGVGSDSLAHGGRHVLDDAVNNRTVRIGGRDGIQLGLVDNLQEHIRRQGDPVIHGRQRLIVRRRVARPGPPGRHRPGAGSSRRWRRTCRWPRPPCAGRASRRVWSGPGCR